MLGRKLVGVTEISTASAKEKACCNVLQRSILWTSHRRLLPWPPQDIDSDLP
jgi:hypothetical protein